MGKTLLIVGQIPDLHISHIVQGVAKRGWRSVVFDPFQKDHYLSLAVNRGGAGSEVRAGESHSALGDIRAVWWRWKPIVAALWQSEGRGIAAQFRQREWRSTLYSLPAFLPGACWINPLRAHEEISHKPRQLEIARQCGFRIPRTLFTNDASAILSGFGKERRLIYKTVSSFIVPPDEMIFTNEVARRRVRDAENSIARAPCTFQELIPKRYELRVTVVGSKMFAVKIRSQGVARTAIDWRHDQLRDMYETTALDARTARLIRRFHAKAGLVFGAYDFIVPLRGDP